MNFTLLQFWALDCRNWTVQVSIYVNLAVHEFSLFYQGDIIGYRTLSVAWTWFAWLPNMEMNHQSAC
jgi:hypothetical protein